MLVPIVFLEMRKPNQVEQFHLENYVHDCTTFGGGMDLLSSWTDELIAKKRLDAVKEFDWENRAPIYRQVNILRAIKLSLQGLQK